SLRRENAVDHFSSLLSRRSVRFVWRRRQDSQTLEAASLNFKKHIPQRPCRASCLLAAYPRAATPLARLELSRRSASRVTAANQSINSRPRGEDVRACL